MVPTTIKGINTARIIVSMATIMQIASMNSNYIRSSTIGINNQRRQYRNNVANASTGNNNVTGRTTKATTNAATYHHRTT
jgi:hypothetical protein